MADWDPLASVCPPTKECLPVNIVSSLPAVFICIDKININIQECVASIISIVFCRQVLVSIACVSLFCMLLHVCLCV